MTADEKEQFLDRYVSGEPMTADEEAQIDHLFKTEPDFQTEYRVRQTLFEAGVQQRRAAWEARRQTNPLPTQPSTLPMRWAAAASVMLLLGLGLFWWVRSNQPVQPTDRRAGQARLFEQRDTQLGLAGADSAVGTVAWEVRLSDSDTYVFEQVDNLLLYSRTPRDWQGIQLQLTRLSETQYRLRAGPRTYLLDQGRSLRLPLRPE